MDVEWSRKLHARGTQTEVLSEVVYFKREAKYASQKLDWYIITTFSDSGVTNNDTGTTQPPLPYSKHHPIQVIFIG